MAPLFDSMDWADEENDLSSAIGSGTQTATEIGPDDPDNTPGLPVRTSIPILLIRRTATNRLMHSRPGAAACVTEKGWVTNSVAIVPEELALL
jgi:hypothetical protein